MNKIIWIEGLPAAGKTTLAKALAAKFEASNIRAINLDGDMLRQGLCADLQFSEADRTENLRRAGEMAKLLVTQGFTVIASFITPTERDRGMLRNIIGAEHWFEVYLATPLAVCESRDPKGLYRRARAGGMKGLTGIDGVFEVPIHADLVLDSYVDNLQLCIDRVFESLNQQHALESFSESHDPQLLEYVSMSHQ